MDLETAQRISLIQRNLETAQVMIDSAVELLGTIIQGAEVSPASARHAPRHTSETDVEPTRDTKKATKRARTIAPDVIRQFLQHHSGEFKATDVLKWARQHGIPADKRKVQQALYSLANAGVEVVSTGKGTGVYKRVQQAA